VNDLGGGEHASKSSNTYNKLVKGKGSFINNCSRGNQGGVCRNVVGETTSRFKSPGHQIFENLGQITQNKRDSQIIGRDGGLANDARKNEIGKKLMVSSQSAA